MIEQWLRDAIEGRRPVATGWSKPIDPTIFESLKQLASQKGCFIFNREDGWIDDELKNFLDRSDLSERVIQGFGYIVASDEEAALLVKMKFGETLT